MIHWPKPHLTFTFLSVLKGSWAAEGGVDAAPHFHRGYVQHHWGARHSGVERDPPQNWDDVQLVGPRLPRPQLFGQCSVWAGLSGRDGGLPQTSGRQQLGPSSQRYTTKLTLQNPPLWPGRSPATCLLLSSRQRLPRSHRVSRGEERAEWIRSWGLSGRMHRGAANGSHTTSFMITMYSRRLNSDTTGAPPTLSLFCEPFTNRRLCF